jgi:hypothetical protein
LNRCLNQASLRLAHSFGLRGLEGQERKQFFFEKKNQKTFDLTD